MPKASILLYLTLQQNVEAILHCIMSIQEAAGNSLSPYFHRLFEAEILRRLPTTGNERVRRTMVGLIGASSSMSNIM